MAAGGLLKSPAAEAAGTSNAIPSASELGAAPAGGVSTTGSSDLRRTPPRSPTGATCAPPKEAESSTPVRPSLSQVAADTGASLPRQSVEAITELAATKPGSTTTVAGATAAVDGAAAQRRAPAWKPAPAPTGSSSTAKVAKPPPPSASDASSPMHGAACRRAADRVRDTRMGAPSRSPRARGRPRSAGRRRCRGEGMTRPSVAPLAVVPAGAAESDKEGSRGAGSSLGRFEATPAAGAPAPSAASAAANAAAAASMTARPAASDAGVDGEYERRRRRRQSEAPEGAGGAGEAAAAATAAAAAATTAGTASGAAALLGGGRRGGVAPRPRR